MHALIRDFGLALRHCRKRPGYTVLVVATLALGIGAATAIFSVVDAVLLRALPYREPERIVLLDELDQAGKRMPLAQPNLDDYAARQRSLSSLARYAGGSTLVTSGAQWARTGAYAVGANLFEVFGVRPERGAGFVADAGAPPARAALVSHEFWRDTLGSPRELGGVALKVFGESVPLAGVLPEGFHFPPDANVWFPADVFPKDLSRTAHNWHAVGRLADGANLDVARQEATALGQALRAQHGGEVDLAALGLTGVHDALVGPVRPILLSLLAGAGFLLMVAGSNVANLFVAQALARRKELAVRAALGAGQGRLVRQFVCESLALALGGALLGVLAARASLGAMLALIGDQLPRAGEIAIDARTLAATLGMSVVLAVLVACAPLVRGPRALLAALKDQNRGGSSGRAAARLRDLMVVAQGALTVVLLITAGLLGRTFLGLVRTDPGFAPEGAVSVSIGDADGLAGAGQRVAALDRLIERLSALPGVAAAGGINALPLTGDGADGSFFDEHADFAAHPVPVGYGDYRVASGGYFRAMGIPLLRGRTFESTDRPDGQHVAVVSRSLAESTWPGRDAIGQRIQYGNMDGDLRVLTVVGVVGDVHDRLDRAPRPTVYVDYAQRPAQALEFHVVLRAAAGAPALAPMLRDALPSIAPGTPLGVRTLDAIYRDSLAPRRFSLSLFALFAVVALGLAASGVYSLIAFSVGERRPEIAVRMALGSSAAGVRRLVLRQGLRLELAALALGAALALVATRLVGTQLVGVDLVDPLVHAAVAVVVLAVGALACWLPARRAAAIPPSAALG